MPKYNQVTSRHVEELQQIVGKNQVIYNDHEKMEPYSHDEVADPAYATMPAVVVKPRNAEDIAVIIKLANKRADSGNTQEGRQRPFWRGGTINGRHTTLNGKNE